MKISRNAPCPCGSGRKYKACCLAADEARARTAQVLGSAAPRPEEARWKEVARLERVWEAEVAPLATHVRDASGSAPSMVMVVAAGYVVHGEVLPYRPAGDGERARELARALRVAERVLGTQPQRVEVRDTALAAALGAELAPRGVSVEVGTLEALDEALDGALEHLVGPVAARMTTPATWRETEATPAELAEFHAAAAEFYRAAPWEVLGSENLLAMRLPDGSEWGATVLGAADIEFGLVLYADPRDVLGVFGMEEDEEEPERTHVETFLDMRGESLRVSFDPRRNVFRAIQREVAEAGWPVAGPEAYPLLFGLHLPERRVTATHVRRATLALRALALLCRAEDPEPATGVRVVPVLAEGVAHTPWPEPEGPAPVCAEGPRAEARAALFAWDTTDEVIDAEAERFERLEGWLQWQGIAPAEREDDVRNARAWTVFLCAHSIPSGAVTEYDLRLFLYEHYPRQAKHTAAMTGALPRSMRRVARFLAEQEGIVLPFAGAVLDELEEMGREWAGRGTPFPEMLKELAEEVDADLVLRLLVHHPAVAGGERWPLEASPEVDVLERELQCRWLLWYDEEVRGGISGFGELADVLVRRQREWEITPHPAHGGLTPAEVVRAFVKESRFAKGGLAGEEAGR